MGYIVTDKSLSPLSPGPWCTCNVSKCWHDNNDIVSECYCWLLIPIINCHCYNVPTIFGTTLLHSHLEIFEHDSDLTRILTTFWLPLHNWPLSFGHAVRLYGPAYCLACFMQHRLAYTGTVCHYCTTVELKYCPVVAGHSLPRLLSANWSTGYCTTEVQPCACSAIGVSEAGLGLPALYYCHCCSAAACRRAALLWPCQHHYCVGCGARLLMAVHLSNLRCAALRRTKYVLVMQSASTLVVSSCIMRMCSCCTLQWPRRVLHPHQQQEVVVHANMFPQCISEMIFIDSP